MTPAPRLFRALADHTRLRIVNLLARGPLCVCDIQRILDEPQSTVSRHLAYLKTAGLVTDRRDGVRVFYALVPANNRLQRAVLGAIRTHVAHTHAVFHHDLSQLRKMRRLGACHDEPASG